MQHILILMHFCHAGVCFMSNELVRTIFLLTFNYQPVENVGDI
jgi:hypothetical protein